MTAPWWLRILAKLVLSRVPIGYRTFARLGMFRHGRMHKPEYATGIFTRHFSRAHERVGPPPRDFVALEFGVGDSIASAILARASGAGRCYLIDAGRYAVEDAQPYRDLVDALRDDGANVAEIPRTATFAEILERYGGVYLTEGLQSLRQIPDGSVDFVWSNAVLEHVRRGDFAAVQRELRRVIKPTGILSHRVDLKDHLGGALNNRRLSSALWERDWFAHSGFYTNRLTFEEMRATFDAAGFATEVVRVDRWEELPTPRSRMAREFHDLDAEALCVSGFDVLLRPR
ncbi:MAG: methyltransferase domain-containing protein [Pseudomonadota bacterium]